MEFTTTHDPQERLHELMQELATEITAFEALTQLAAEIKIPTPDEPWVFSDAYRESYYKVGRIADDLAAAAHDITYFYLESLRLL